MCLCKQNIPTGVIKVLSHKMDESTKNIFKKELEYLINFENEQANFINNFKLAIHNQISDSIERDEFLEKSETEFKDATGLAQIIFETFDNISFNSDNLIRQVFSFNTKIRNFRSYFTILCPSSEISDLIAAIFYLSSLIQNLKNINEMVDLTFSNSRIF